MPEFSKQSLQRLLSCHPDLQKICHEAIKHYDFTVLDGHRTKAAQDEAVRAGNSQTPWPKSKHNSLPSLAVDLVPYPIDWKDRSRFSHFAGFIEGIAQGLGIKIRWGGDWDSDHDFKDNNFDDLVHFELY